MGWMDGLRVMVGTIEISDQHIAVEVDGAQTVQCDDDLAGVGLRQQVEQTQAAQDCASYGERWSVCLI